MRNWGSGREKTGKDCQTVAKTELKYIWRGMFKFMRPGLFFVKRTPIVILTLAFLFNTALPYDLAWAKKTDTMPSPIGEDKSVSPGQLFTLGPNEITIPPAFGSVKERFQQDRDSKGLIVHIQDLHTHYQAHKNIARIVDHLTRKHGINVVLAEAKATDRGFAYLRPWTTQESRDKVAEENLKNGVLTGWEALDLTSDLDLVLQGIEDKSLYMRDMDAFLAAETFRPDALRFVDLLKNTIDNLKLHMYSKAQKRFDEKLRAYRDEKIGIAEYADYLSKLAKRYKAEYKDYLNLNILGDTLRLEGKIDFKKAQREREEIIDALAEALSEDDVKILLNMSMKFKANRISQNEFYQYLLMVADKHDVDIEKYTDFNTYTHYIASYHNLDASKLFEEINTLENRLAEALFTKEDQKRLFKISKDLIVLRGLVDFKLTPDEFDYYAKTKSEFDINNWLAFLKLHAEYFNLTQSVPNDASIVLDNLATLEKFYKTAHKRDEAFVKNIELQFNKRNINAAFLMTGGFHTPGVTRRLKEAGYSYVIVAPVIEEKMDYDNYHKVLKDAYKRLREVKVLAAWELCEVDNDLLDQIVQAGGVRHVADLDGLRTRDAIVEVVREADGSLAGYIAPQLLPLIQRGEFDLNRLLQLVHRVRRGTATGPEIREFLSMVNNAKRAIREGGLEGFTFAGELPLDMIVDQVRAGNEHVLIEEIKNAIRLGDSERVRDILLELLNNELLTDSRIDGLRTALTPEQLGALEIALADARAEADRGIDGLAEVVEAILRGKDGVEAAEVTPESAREIAQAAVRDPSDLADTIARRVPSAREIAVTLARNIGALTAPPTGPIEPTYPPAIIPVIQSVITDALSVAKVDEEEIAADEIEELARSVAQGDISPTELESQLRETLSVPLPADFTRALESIVAPERDRGRTIEDVARGVLNPAFEAADTPLPERERITEEIARVAAEEGIAPEGLEERILGVLPTELEGREDRARELIHILESIVAPTRARERAVEDILTGRLERELHLGEVTPEQIREIARIAGREGITPEQVEAEIVTRIPVLRDSAQTLGRALRLVIVPTMALESAALDILAGELGGERLALPRVRITMAVGREGITPQQVEDILAQQLPAELQGRAARALEPLIAPTMPRQRAAENILRGRLAEELREGAVTTDQIREAARQAAREDLTPEVLQLVFAEILPEGRARELVRAVEPAVFPARARRRVATAILTARLTDELDEGVITHPEVEGVAETVSATQRPLEQVLAVAGLPLVVQRRAAELAGALELALTPELPRERLARDILRGLLVKEIQRQQITPEQLDATASVAAREVYRGGYARAEFDRAIREELPPELKDNAGEIGLALELRLRTLRPEDVRRRSAVITILTGYLGGEVTPAEIDRIVLILEDKATTEEVRNGLAEGLPRALRGNVPVLAMALEPVIFPTHTRERAVEDILTGELERELHLEQVTPQQIREIAQIAGREGILPEQVAAEIAGLAERDDIPELEAHAQGLGRILRPVIAPTMARERAALDILAGELGGERLALNRVRITMAVGREGITPQQVEDILAQQLPAELQGRAARALEPLIAPTMPRQRAAENILRGRLAEELREGAVTTDQIREAARQAAREDLTPEVLQLVFAEILPEGRARELVRAVEPAVFPTRARQRIARDILTARLTPEIDRGEITLPEIARIADALGVTQRPLEEVLPGLLILPVRARAAELARALEQALTPTSARERAVEYALRGRLAPELASGEISGPEIGQLAQAVTREGVAPGEIETAITSTLTSAHTLQERAEELARAVEPLVAPEAARQRVQQEARREVTVDALRGRLKAREIEQEVTADQVSRIAQTAQEAPDWLEARIREELPAARDIIPELARLVRRIITPLTEGPEVTARPRRPVARPELIAAAADNADVITVTHEGVVEFGGPVQFVQGRPQTVEGAVILGPTDAAELTAGEVRFLRMPELTAQALRGVREIVGRVSPLRRIIGMLQAAYRTIDRDMGDVVTGFEIETDHVIDIDVRAIARNAEDIREHKTAVGNYISVLIAEVMYRCRFATDRAFINFVGVDAEVQEELVRIYNDLAIVRANPRSMRLYDRVVADGDNMENVKRTTITHEDSDYVPAEENPVLYVSDIVVGDQTINALTWPRTIIAGFRMTTGYRPGITVAEIERALKDPNSVHYRVRRDLARALVAGENEITAEMLYTIYTSRSYNPEFNGINLRIRRIEAVDYDEMRRLHDMLQEVEFSI